jgi:chromosome segregation ATPase
MTVEIHAKWITLLAEVDELKSKEAALKSEKQRHLEQIAQSEGEVSRCSDELRDIRESQHRLKREMDDLRDELFHREEEEAITVDDAHVVPGVRAFDQLPTPPETPAANPTNQPENNEQDDRA